MHHIMVFECHCDSEIYNFSYTDIPTNNIVVTVVPHGMID